MGADVTFTGLEEFKAQLRALPRTLQDGAQALAREEAEAFAQELPAAYQGVLSTSTGELTRDIRVTDLQGATGVVGAEVRNRSRKAHWFEFGTALRFTRGSGAGRGRVSARPIFVPMAMRRRRRLLSRLRAFVQAATGASISGE